MILQINNEWRIVSDAAQWTVQRLHTAQKGKRAGESAWVNEAYCTDPAHAAIWCAQRRIRDLPGTYPAADGLEAIGEALQEIVGDVKRIADAL